MIAHVLFTLRTHFHFSQQQLANYLHIGRVAYRYYETGKNRPPLDILYALSVFYHIPLDAVYGRQPLILSDCFVNLREFHALTLPTQNELLLILGSRLRNFRLGQGLRQEDFSKLFGISRAACSYYESGKRQPPAGLLIQFAEYYRVTVDLLCGFDPQADRQ